MTYENVDRIGKAYKKIEDHINAHYGNLKGLEVGRLSLARHGHRLRLCLVEANRPLLDCGIADRVSIEIHEIKLFLQECARAKRALEDRAAVRANELETFVEDCLNGSVH